MSWTITETNAIDPAAVDRLGNKFLTGNGAIGYRGTLEEYTRDQKTATIFNGLYDQTGKQWREPVNLPNGAFLQVIYQGERLHALYSSLANHSQSLDLYQAVHRRQTTFICPDGNQISVSARRFVSLAERHLLCLEYTLTSAQDGMVSICTGIDGDVWDINGPHLVEFQAIQADTIISLAAQTQEHRTPIAISEWISADGQPPIVRVEPQGIFREFELPCQAGQPQTIIKLIAIYTGLDSPDPLADSQALARAAAQISFEKHLKAHAGCWEMRWKRCAIQIEGDQEAEQALLFSQYHLLAIAPEHTETLSIPGRGLSGQMYKGAIFWDTEIFMLPFFSHHFPKIARNLLLYRYHTLQGARKKAAAYGYRGAFYAWESQENGQDACTLFNVTDVFTNRPMRTYFRDKQIHISADIVYAFWAYYTVTGDISIFLEGGAEVIAECARFYLSALYYRPDRHRYEFLDVTGPDEYHERVHNNAFTNWMIAHTFEVCLQINALLEQHYPQQAKALSDRLGFQADLEAIRQTLPAIFRPAPNMAHQIPQFDGYFDLEDISLPDLKARKQHPHEYLGGGNGLATTTQIIKQADVILGLYLFRDQFSPEVKAANWEYYEPRTEHGSSLSACSYALIAAEIGKIDWAYQYFMKTATIDLTGESKQYVGTLYIGGTHPAGNGGAWMAAVFGLCGLLFQGNTLTIQPHLPSHWKTIRLPLTLHGRPFQLAIGQSQIIVQALSESSEQLFLRLGQQVISLPQAAQSTLTLTYQPEAVTP